VRADHPLPLYVVVGFSKSTRQRWCRATYRDPGLVTQPGQHDHATYYKPRRYASSVTHVLVNRVTEVREGKFGGPGAGRALRRGRA